MSEKPPVTPKKSISSSGAPSSVEREEQKVKSPAKDNHASVKSFNDTISLANNCLYLVRELRLRMKKLQKCVFEKYDKDMPKEDRLEFYTAVEDWSVAIQNTYSMMMKEVVRLPETLPITKDVKEMDDVYSAEHIFLSKEIDNRKLDVMVDKSNWNEAQYQYFHYLSQFLKRSAPQKKSFLQHKKLSDMLHIERKREHFKPHNLYQFTLREVTKEIVNRNLGIREKLLHSTASSTVMMYAYEMGKQDSQDIASLFKIIIIEKNGRIEYINVLAGQELITWDNDFHRKYVHGFKPSRYLVYRKLTEQINRLLRLHFASFEHWNKTNLTQLITMIGRIRDVFEAKCTICNQHLRNFMPPTIFEFRSTHAPQHEACAIP